MSSTTKRHDDGDYGFYGKEALDRSVKLILNNRIFQLIIAVLVFILILLTSAYFSLSKSLTTQVNLPPYGTFDIARMEADPLYYRVWADFVLNYMSNFTPTNIDGNIKEATQVFDHDVFVAKKPEFDAYYQSIKTNQITQRFQFDATGVSVKLEKSGSEATVKYNGVAFQKIANLATRRKVCFYEMHFFINNFKIYQDAIKTDCLDDNTIVPKGADEVPQKKGELIDEEDLANSGLDDFGMMDGTEKKPANKAPSPKEVMIQGTLEKDYKIRVDKDYILSGLKGQGNKNTQPASLAKEVGTEANPSKEKETPKININEDEKGTYEAQ
ncbi:hypothetical protein BKH46_08605 [Helicobacter sp. 12S02634-8]|uniref:TraE/TraK family type IV conjugative transfer system protein n=1 Tax=Helicobacter sp. 12S02634-8 TaxID=1476199 RepID=UPI000BA5431A|nr:TraE/TraK family type IV conjugative transfer system protein [Helicobacter sp. 12S02634-8]PAF46187.1 hypothetical protein BKH46_08605 [Helicobacter sp. 12S02634-8]